MSTTTAVPLSAQLQTNLTKIKENFDYIKIFCDQAKLSAIHWSDDEVEKRNNLSTYMMKINDKMQEIERIRKNLETLKPTPPPPPPPSPTTPIPGHTKSPTTVPPPASKSSSTQKRPPTQQQPRICDSLDNFMYLMRKRPKTQNTSSTTGNKTDSTAPKPKVNSTENTNTIVAGGDDSMVEKYSGSLWFFQQQKTGHNSNGSLQRTLRKASSTNSKLLQQHHSLTKSHLTNSKLPVYDLLDEVQDSDVVPLKSEYPRRDNNPMDSELITRSYLYQLVYEMETKSDVMWRQLFESQQPQVYTTYPVHIVVPPVAANTVAAKKATIINRKSPQTGRSSNNRNKTSDPTNNLRRTVSSSATVKKPSDSSTTTYKMNTLRTKQRQKTVLGHLQTIKNKNNSMYRNLQKSITVLEDKMADLITTEPGTSSGGDNTAVVFAAMEHEVTKVLHMIGGTKGRGGGGGSSTMSSTETTDTEEARPQSTVDLVESDKVWDKFERVDRKLNEYCAKFPESGDGTTTTANTDTNNVNRGSTVPVPPPSPIAKSSNEIDNKKIDEECLGEEEEVVMASNTPSSEDLWSKRRTMLWRFYAAMFFLIFLILSLDFV